MYAKLLGVLLFACTIILNESSVVHENRNSVTNVTLAPAPTTTLPEGYVSFSEDHAAYKIHRISVTWERARQLCIAEGARLAIADTGDKIRHIVSTVSDIGNWISVGIRFRNATNEWVRADNGLALTSLPWKAFTPDDDGDCVAISFYGEELLNFSCNVHTNWYVCEVQL